MKASPMSLLISSHISQEGLGRVAVEEDGANSLEAGGTEGGHDALPN
jgi:hypothetical protein